MYMIPVSKHLEPYFELARIEAAKSPCIRRQYGAVLASKGNIIEYEGAYNKRVSPCCNGNICARDRYQTRHGGSVEIGGEVHAETALMIDSHKGPLDRYMVLVGYEKGKELLGKNVYPCHSCAISVKYAGYKHIFIHNKQGVISPIAIDEVITSRIEEWEPND